MASTRRFSLNYTLETGKWTLRDERTGRAVKSFGSKEAATRAGVLESALGSAGGSVIIRKKGGVFEEERRYAGRG